MRRDKDREMYKFKKQNINHYIKYILIIKKDEYYK